MKSHERINELLAGFVLGELTDEQRTEVKAHLAKCQQCRGELKRLEALLECTSRMRELSTDKQMCESAKEAIFASVGSEELRKSTLKTKARWYRAACISAIAASVILLFWLLLISALNKNKVEEIDTSPYYILAEAQNNHLKETRPCDILPPLPN